MCLIRIVLNYFGARTIHDETTWPVRFHAYVSRVVQPHLVFNNRCIQPSIAELLRDVLSCLVVRWRTRYMWLGSKDLHVLFSSNRIWNGEELRLVRRWNT